MSSENKNTRFKELKNRVRFSSSVDLELHDKFCELSNQTSIPKSKLLDKAIKLLLLNKDNLNDI